MTTSSSSVSNINRLVSVVAVIILRNKKPNNDGRSNEPRKCSEKDRHGPIFTIQRCDYGVFCHSVPKRAGGFGFDRINAAETAKKPNINAKPNKCSCDAKDRRNKMMNQINCILAGHLPRNNGHCEVARVSLAKLFRVVSQGRKTRIKCSAEIATKLDSFAFCTVVESDLGATGVGASSCRM